MARRRATTPLIAARFQVDADSARAGSGTWTARDTESGRVVTVVEIPEPTGLTESERAAWRDRARASMGRAERFRHAHIVGHIAVGEFDGRLVAVTENAQGETLAELVGRLGPLSASRAATLGTQLADALAVAHADGLTHGVLCPATVLVTGDDARITHFGLGAAVDDLRSIPASSSLSANEAFAAPDRPTGGSAASDVWSLGAVVRYALMGGTDGPAADGLGASDGDAPDGDDPAAQALTSILDRLQTTHPVDRPSVVQARDEFGSIPAARHAGRRGRRRRETRREERRRPATAADPTPRDEAGHADSPGSPSDSSRAADSVWAAPADAPGGVVTWAPEPFVDPPAPVPGTAPAPPPDPAGADPAAPGWPDPSESPTVDVSVPADGWPEPAEPANPVDTVETARAPAPAAPAAAAAPSPEAPAEMPASPSNDTLAAPVAATAQPAGPSGLSAPRRTPQGNPEATGLHMAPRPVGGQITSAPSRVLGPRTASPVVVGDSIVELLGAVSPHAPEPKPISDVVDEVEEAEEEPERPYRSTFSWPPQARVSVFATGLILLVLGVLVVLLVTNGSVGRESRPGSATATSLPAATTEVTLPDGWLDYRYDSPAYSIGRPASWTITQEGTVTILSDPNSGAFLRVDFDAHVPSGPAPERVWLDLEQSLLREAADYTRLQIQPTTFNGYKAAVWEFTYTEGGTEYHAVDLGLIAGSYRYALYFETPEEEWSGLLVDAFYPLANSFRPPR